METRVNSSITSGINQVSALRSWVVQAEDARKIKTKIQAYNIISKICRIASLALIAVAIFFSQVIVARAIAIPFVALTSLTSQVLENKRVHLSNESTKIERISRKLKLIKEWDDLKIRQFFQLNNISPPAEFTLLQLAPIISHFETINEEIRAIKEEIHEKLSCLDKSREERLSARSIAWYKLENQLVPLLFDAALILEILSEPALKLDIHDLGYFHIKSFPRRQFDRIYGPDDDYFVFHEKTRRPITLKEIENDMTPRAVHAKLFPNKK